ncbi:capsule assembly Wzi family protein [Pseudoalteromonas sp. T1lg75]|uniref:capsule assembly Wzi family protein n=1 Tax=Pseudoalteromonas sp. T1lg75 TaxID=2077102 RepID=UPI000CF62565|nr:capsule assembly Wzi family protein [Pseudoalteromonas sp. T1lg75]
MTLSRCALALSASLCAAQAHAGPWIDPDSALLRSSIDMLVNQGVINRPVNTYPLMWKGIAGDLQAVSVQELTPQARFAYHHVQHALKYAQQGTVSRVRVFTNSEPHTIQGFGPRNQAKSGIETSGSLTGKTASAKVSVSYRDDSNDGEYVNYDGSYVAALLGNWSLSGEKIHHWWGPGQENALALSNNAQAMTGVRLTRHDTNYYGPSWLAFIGPWNFTAIAAKQQSQVSKIGEEKVEDGDFWGWRFSATPIQGLELGLSQTKSEWLHYPDSLSGMVINADELADEQKLSSLDIKYSTLIGTLPLSIYGEYAGHIESALIAEDGAFTLGAQTHYGTEQALLSGYIEYTDTSSECVSQLPEYNCNYGNLGIAQGYQHREQNLGPAMGADAEALTLGATYHRMGGYGAHLKLGRIEKEQMDADISRLEIGYQQGIFGALVNITGHLWRESNDLDSDTHSAVSMALEYRF